MAVPVEGPPRVEPSGLCFAEGMLLAVSDKHDTAIYRFEFSESVGAPARMVPHREFRAPPRKGVRRFDFEAVHYVPKEKKFYLASEMLSDLLRVDSESGAAEWIGLGLPSAAAGARQNPPLPYLRKPNAGIEGLAELEHPSRFVLAAEREPRGLLVLPQLEAGNYAKARWFPIEHSVVKLSGTRLADYSDLEVYNGKLFALSRNAEAIVELTPSKTGKSWRETRAWSFSHTVRDPRFAYMHSAFGMAEGLAIERDAIWIVLDNNRSWRVGSERDRRPLLFRFARPLLLE